MRFKEYSELCFSDAYMFEKVLLHNPNLCKRVLEVLLSLEIERIILLTVIERKDHWNDFLGEILYVSFETWNGEHYSVKLAFDGVEEFRHHNYFVDLMLVDDYSTSRKNQKNRYLALGLKDVFKRNIPFYNFRYTCENCPDLCKSVDTELIYAYVSPELSGISDECRALYMYLCYNIKGSQLTKDIDKAVKKLKKDSNMEDDYMEKMVEHSMMFFDDEDDDC